MVRDEEIERIAVQAVIAHEEARGWKVESVEKDNRGFDLISRKPHPEDPQTAIEVRFIEVKGRAARRGDCAQFERIQDCREIEKGLLALRGFQLRLHARDSHRAGPGSPRLGTHRKSRTFPCQCERDI